MINANTPVLNPATRPSTILNIRLFQSITISILSSHIIFINIYHSFKYTASPLVARHFKGLLLLRIPNPSIRTDNRWHTLIRTNLIDIHYQRLLHWMILIPYICSKNEASNVIPWAWKENEGKRWNEWETMLRCRRNITVKTNVAHVASKEPSTLLDQTIIHPYMIQMNCTWLELAVFCTIDEASIDPQDDTKTATNIARKAHVVIYLDSTCLCIFTYCDSRELFSLHLSSNGWRYQRSLQSLPLWIPWYSMY